MSPEELPRPEESPRRLDVETFAAGERGPGVPHASTPPGEEQDEDRAPPAPSPDAAPPPGGTEETPGPSGDLPAGGEPLEGGRADNGAPPGPASGDAPPGLEGAGTEEPEGDLPVLAGGTSGAGELATGDSADEEPERPRDRDREAEEVLERLERSALLSGLRETSSADGPPPGIASPDPETWTPHDFRQEARRIVSAEFSRLEKATRRFVAEASSRLSALLRQRVRLGEPKIDVGPHGEFVGSLGENDQLHPVHCRALRAGFLLAVTPRVLLAAVERLLGATPGIETPPDRALTDLEASLAGPFLDRLLTALDESWRGEGRLDLEFAPPDRVRDLLRRRPAEQPIVRVACSVDVEGVEGRLRIAVPQGPLLSYLSGPRAEDAEGERALDAGTLPEAEAEACRQRILERLRPAEVEVSAELTTEPLPLRELLALRPGDCIDTGVPLGRPVEVHITGRPVSRGIAGHIDGKLAVRISED